MMISGNSTLSGSYEIIISMGRTSYSMILSVSRLCCRHGSAQLIGAHDKLANESQAAEPSPA